MKRSKIEILIPVIWLSLSSMGAAPYQEPLPSVSKKIKIVNEKMKLFEQNMFSFQSVCSSTDFKIVRQYPHYYGDEKTAENIRLLSNKDNKVILDTINERFFLKSEYANFSDPLYTSIIEKTDNKSTACQPGYASGNISYKLKVKASAKRSVEFKISDWLQDFSRDDEQLIKKASDLVQLLDNKKLYLNCYDTFESQVNCDNGSNESFGKNGLDESLFKGCKIDNTDFDFKNISNLDKTSGKKTSSSQILFKKNSTSESVQISHAASPTDKTGNKYKLQSYKTIKVTPIGTDEIYCKLRKNRFCNAHENRITKFKILIINLDKNQKHSNFLKVNDTIGFTCQNDQVAFKIGIRYEDERTEDLEARFAAYSAINNTIDYDPEAEKKYEQEVESMRKAYPDTAQRSNSKKEDIPLPLALILKALVGIFKFTFL